MDPRQARTRQALRSAVLELVERMPLADVSVTDAARAAGISRDTFYRHATGVGDLLAQALGAELDVSVAEFAAARGTDRERFEIAERALLAHVARHRAVYLHALAPRLAAEVRLMLLEHVEVPLRAYLAEHPEVAPVPDGELAGDALYALYAAYGAAGTVGAIEHWLLGGATGDADDIARGVLAVSAQWWWRGA
ncbi:TetR/AcrR family transcriptional regulator [Agromyces sp. SYSU T00194]|uniref:TetR/AcrR family transcriptional regulator n=1 Tax=Agromyces chitinivorans TaxID=3158560 RepID=UPI00339A7684